MPDPSRLPTTPPRVTALLGDEDTGIGTVHDYLSSRPALVTGYRPRTLTGLPGVQPLAQFLFAVRQFLDDVRRPQDDAERRALLEPEPPTTGDVRRDAFVAGLAEYLTVRAGITVPGWTQDECRCLSTWWFVHEPVFDALALVQSPAAFRRRGIFLSSDFFSRV